jgi:hypothetical protein
MKYYFLLIIISISCVRHDNASKAKSLVVNNSRDTIVTDNAMNIDLKNIEGIWAKNEQENALFQIKGDSIFYLEHPESKVTYETNKDTFIIFYDGLTTKNKILKLDTDSFIFETEVNYINRLYKRK